MESSRSPESNSRLQKVDKVSLLGQCPLFTSLSQWELKSISQLMRLVEYKKGETVYEEGGEADGFYVVVSGRFEATVQALGKKKILAYLRRGDYFGEMSLLTKQPHSATLSALSDCLTLFLKKDDFEKTIEHNAIISLELSRRLSSRLKGADPRSRTLLRSDVVSIYSHQRQIGRTAFAINLAASLIQETHQKTILLDMSPSGNEIAARLHMARKVPLTRFQGIESGTAEALSDFIVRHPVGFEVLSVAHDERDSLGESIITPLLNHLAIDYRFILIDLPNGIDGLVMKAFSQSDSIFFVTDSHITNVTETRETIADLQRGLSHPDEKFSIVINESMFGIRATSAIKKELFGSKNCYSLPAVAGLKDHGPGEDVLPYVVDEPEVDYSRVIRHVARRLSNNLVGIAFGSGAAFGLAHVGVIKVLERERIPIDIVSGSSIGSLIGGLLAIGKTAAEIEEAAMEINSTLKLVRLLDFCLFPWRGLFHGQVIMKHFKKHFGVKTFEDCKVPLKILGANLSARQAITFDSGFVLDAVRASIAIPAIFKPVLMKGDVVVDGGILSPLPVRALHEAGANKVIAVNVFPTTKDTLERRLLLQEAEEKEERAMRQANAFYRGAWHLRRFLRKRITPNLFDVLVSSIQTMESEIAETEGESADVLLRPVVPTASWVEFYHAERFIRRGEEEAMRLLPKIKLLVSQQNI